jgi:hypothetical protein
VPASRQVPRPTSGEHLREMFMATQNGAEVLATQNG